MILALDDLGRAILVGWALWACLVCGYVLGRRSR